MTKKITFCSMMAVLGILCFVVSNIFQTNTIFLYLLSTLFTYISTEEHGIRFGLLTFFVIGIVGFLLAVNKVGIAAYIIAVGYYPVIKHIIEHFSINKALKYVLKIAFVLVISTVALLVMLKVLFINPFNEMNLIIVYPLGVAIFLAYDVALTMGIKFYALRLRKFK